MHETDWLAPRKESTRLSQQRQDPVQETTYNIHFHKRRHAFTRHSRSNTRWCPNTKVGTTLTRHDGPRGPKCCFEQHDTSKMWGDAHNLDGKNKQQKRPKDRTGQDRPRSRRSCNWFGHLETTLLCQALVLGGLGHVALHTNAVKTALAVDKCRGQMTRVSSPAHELSAHAGVV